VVVLGTTGRNFAAGMSGGLAYVWNKQGNFDYYCNMEMVELSLIEDSRSRKELLDIIQRHYQHTGSPLAVRILARPEQYLDEFIQVTPIEYKKVLQEEQLKSLQERIEKVERDF
jgi:glutamate synthase (NADPH/NADH) large chain